ncbi:hypothetical protein HAX54_050180, partial [Datura stramonium]|nr:hypothetical protein [Datura stramonium]
PHPDQDKKDFRIVPVTTTGCDDLSSSLMNRPVFRLEDVQKLEILSQHQQLVSMNCVDHQ